MQKTRWAAIKVDCLIKEDRDSKRVEVDWCDILINHSILISAGERGAKAKREGIYSNSKTNIHQVNELMPE